MIHALNSCSIHSPPRWTAAASLPEYSRSAGCCPNAIAALQRRYTLRPRLRTCFKQSSRTDKKVSEAFTCDNVSMRATCDRTAAELLLGNSPHQHFYTECMFRCVQTLTTKVLGRFKPTGRMPLNSLLFKSKRCEEKDVRAL